MAPDCAPYTAFRVGVSHEPGSHVLTFAELCVQLVRAPWLLLGGGVPLIVPLVSRIPSRTDTTD